MKITALPIHGAYLLNPTLFNDERGTFRRHFCKETLSSHNINIDVAQGNISENPTRGTLRGFHYQVHPFQEGKLISCITGSLFNVIIDIRRSSPTYLNSFSTQIDNIKRQTIFVPQGCANCFLTLSDSTIVHYYMSQSFVEGSYRGFLFDDPQFGIKWPAQPTLISDKDKALPRFDPARDSLP